LSIPKSCVSIWTASGSCATFATDLSVRADAEADPAATACALDLLQQWARAGALLQQPPNFESIRQRQRFTLTFDIVVLS